MKTLAADADLEEDALAAAEEEDAAAAVVDAALAAVVADAVGTSTITEKGRQNRPFLF